MDFANVHCTVICCRFSNCLLKLEHLKEMHAHMGKHANSTQKGRNLSANQWATQTWHVDELESLKLSIKANLFIYTFLENGLMDY